MMHNQSAYRGEYNKTAVNIILGQLNEFESLVYASNSVGYKYKYINVNLKKEDWLDSDEDHDQVFQKQWRTEIISLHRTALKLF